MSGTRRTIVFVVLAVAVVAATVGYLAWERFDSDPAGDGSVALGPETLDATLFFRSTAESEDYGAVAAVKPGDPLSDATATARRCDRVDVAPDRTMVCLSAVASIVPRTHVSVLRPDGSEIEAWTVAGIPSRVQFSPGSRVATTTFVEGHSYAEAGFSTATEVRRIGGEKRDGVNLEDFELVLDGRPAQPVDRNYWGVTFVDDSAFYATVSTGGETWLVRGDLEDETLTSMRKDAECPSLSPDGHHLVYKKRKGHPGATWTLAVMNLDTGAERLLGEQRSVDDQVEWLDDDTVLYAVPQPDRLGASDVWALDIEPGAEPELLVEDAQSPSVVAPSR